MIKPVEYSSDQLLFPERYSGGTKKFILLRNALSYRLYMGRLFAQVFEILVRFLIVAI